MQLTVQYSAPLPPGFQSGSLTLTSRVTYIDKDGRVNQPVYRAVINPDRGLSNVQGGAQLQIIGMGQGDPIGAGVLDVVVSMVVTGLPTPLKYTFQVVPADTGGGNLNLHAPNINLPVIGPLPETLQGLINLAGIAAQAGIDALQDAQDLTALQLSLIPSAIQQLQDQGNSAAAVASAAAGLTAVTSYDSIPAADGYYRILSGSAAGQVWQRSGGVLTERFELEAVTSAGLSIVSTKVYIPYRYQILPDATAAIQALIDALPAGRVLDGGRRKHTVTSLLLKSYMTIQRGRLVTKAGSTDFISPLTIDGRPTIPGDLNSGLKQHITIRDMEVDGNRINQSDVVSPEENGGRHGLRVLGRARHILVENSWFHHCSSDGLEFYSWTGRNKTDDTDYCFQDITLRRVTSTFNRRHSLSLDSFTRFRIELGCKLNDNGLDLVGIDPATPYTHGSRGDTVGINHLTYGNAIDVEGYGVGSGFDGFFIDGYECLRNARGGILFYDPTDQTAAGFAPRKNIYIGRGKVDKGVGNSYTGEAISFTPTIAHKRLGTMYDNITLADNEISGYVLARAVGTASIRGGSMDYTAAPLLADQCGTLTLGSDITYKNRSAPYADTATILQGVTKNLTGAATPALLPIGTEIKQNGPTADQYALLATLPAGNGTTNRLTVELIGGAYNGNQQQVTRVNMSNFNIFGAVIERVGLTAAGIGVVAYAMSDGSVQVYLKTLANKYIYALSRAVLQLASGLPAAVAPAAFSATVPSGSLVLNTLDTATYPTYADPAITARLTALETNATATAPTVTFNSGTTGVLSAVSMTLRKQTPYEVTYYWNAVWTPASSGATNFSKFAVSTPSGFQPPIITPFLTDRKTGTAGDAAVNGAAGTVFAVTNISTDLELSCYITLPKS